MIKEIGSGAYGVVMMAENKATKQQVAIKLVKDCFRHSICARKIYREIKILRKLTRLPQNIFTTKLIDIIVPEELGGAGSKDEAGRGESTCLAASERN